MADYAFRYQYRWTDGCVKLGFFAVSLFCLVTTADFASKCLLLALINIENDTVHSEVHRIYVFPLSIPL